MKHTSTFLLSVVFATILFTPSILASRRHSYDSYEDISLSKYLYPKSYERRLQDEKKQEEKKQTEQKQPEQKQAEEKKGEAKKPEEPKEAVCKSIGFFTGEDTSKPRKVVENTSGICSYIEKSCCTADDFKAIKTWWEGAPGANVFRQKQR